MVVGEARRVSTRNEICYTETQHTGGGAYMGRRKWVGVGVGVGVGGLVCVGHSFILPYTVDVKVRIVARLGVVL